jgi:hypothetical protein
LWYSFRVCYAVTTTKGDLEVEMLGLGVYWVFWCPQGRLERDFLSPNSSALERDSFNHTLHQCPTVRLGS